MVVTINDSSKQLYCFDDNAIGYDNRNDNVNDNNANNINDK